MFNSVVAENISKKYEISKFQKETQFRDALINFAKRKLFNNKEQIEEIWALKDVSFSLENGETIGIIGDNGAGKSTILKILSKITYPTSGKIKIKGRVASLLEVGTGFHDELSGRENVYLNGSILGMKKKEVKAKLDAIVSYAEVEKFLDTPIKRYSSGMRMRLGFSVAAHLDTDILFIDEVLSVGDASFQKKCLGTMGEMRTSGKTVIFVSHNMPTVENLCPRVMWIDKGEIRKDGPAVEVIEKYLSQYETFAMQNSMKYDFRNFFGREGSGEINYTGLEFLDTAGQQKTIVRSGDNLKVRLFYEVHETVLNPKFYFTFHTEKGGRIATFGSSISGHYINRLLPGNGYVDIDIDSLNVMPDRYYFSFWIAGDREKKYFERIEWCARLDVEYSNYFKSGKGIDKEFGYVFIPCNWNFHGDMINESNLNQENNQ
jgi:lipopolysaccharide transport system ATP-binding protein